MSGQTLTDRIAAAQYQLTGSDMARAVCKATTHEVMAPKKKHLECKCCLFPLLCTWCDTAKTFIASDPHHNHLTIAHFYNILEDVVAIRMDLVTPLVTLDSAYHKDDPYSEG